MFRVAGSLQDGARCSFDIQSSSILPSSISAGGSAVRALLVTFLAAAAALLAVGSAFSPARAVPVQFRIVNPQDEIMPGRLHLRESNGIQYPGEPDSVLLSHNGGGNMRGYFYPVTPFDVDLPAGGTRICAARGFEWTPIWLPSVDVQQDTVITLMMDQFIDMEALGWFCGDVHVHRLHPPNDYPVTPEQLHWIGQCEALDMIWSLDYDVEFTGGPHEVSTDDVTIYVSTEWRSQISGHAPLLGLTELMGPGCCWPPEPAYPLITILHQQWQPGFGQGLTLAHPFDGADFFDYGGGWPAGGLGRELPVMAALGGMEALDIAAYSNEPDIWVADWYQLLNCGFHIPPSAGTDAIVTRYWMQPPGGYRVYVKEPGPINDHALWVEGLKSGNCFVTDFPLIPEFTVDGVEPGGTVEVSGPEANLDVHFRVESAIPVTQAKLIRNGTIAQTFTKIFPFTSMDTTATIPFTESGWIALRVDGTTSNPVVVSSDLFAHSGAVYVDMDGEGIRQTEPAARFLGWIDSLEVFVETRGNWDSAEERLQCLGTLEDARDVYRDNFQVPPEPFDLLTPADGETLDMWESKLFDWTDSGDTEAGDQIHYVFYLYADTSTFSTAIDTFNLDESEFTFEPGEPDSSRTYWWKVEAIDLGKNKTVDSDGRRSFFNLEIPASTPGKPPTGAADLAGPGRLEFWPNPTSRGLWIRVGEDPRSPYGVALIDASGRRVFESRLDQPTDPLERRGPGLFYWSGVTPSGTRVPSGVYWVRLLCPRESRERGDCPEVDGGGRIVFLR